LIPARLYPGQDSGLTDLKLSYINSELVKARGWLELGKRCSCPNHASVDKLNVRHSMIIDPLPTMIGVWKSG